MNNQARINSSVKKSILQNQQLCNLNNLLPLNGGVSFIRKQDILRNVKISDVPIFKSKQKQSTKSGTKALAKNQDQANSKNLSKNILTSTYVINSGNQLEWVTTSYPGFTNVLYVEYASVAKYNGRTSHIYFIDAMKNGTFHLHMVKFDAPHYMKRISEWYNTFEEAEKATNKYYLSYLASLKNFL